MSCASGSVPTRQNALVEDLLFVHPVTAARRYRPSDRGELVEAVARAAAEGRGVRPLGSNWSLSDTGVAQDVIDTDALSRHLSAPFPNPGQALPPQRLRGGGDFLRFACGDDPRQLGRHFVHVEAGIKLRDLLADLAVCGLALPTMGDGAGQSLAGAISTGTHGGDLRVPPLVEWVRAVHLVSATGREVWITARDSPFSAAPLVTQLPDWCPDARFIADDDTFAAARLGAGRMGAVYAIVLEVVAQYTLVESNFEYRWSELGARLAASRLGADGVATGLFDAPLRDLDAGFFRTEVLRRTYYPAIGREAKFIYERGPERWPGVPAYFDAHPDVYARLLEEHKLTGLAADLRGGPEMPLHHLNIAISLADPERCWVRRRWLRAQTVRAHEVAPAADDALIVSVKANKTNPLGVVGALKDRSRSIPFSISSDGSRTTRGSIASTGIWNAGSQILPCSTKPSAPPAARRCSSCCAGSPRTPCWTRAATWRRRCRK
jgi:FAD/FMN-containing dehydrogenase